MKRLNRINLVLLVLLLMALPCSAWGKTITLSWDASPSAIAGYKIYYDANTSSSPLNGTGATEGGSPIDVGNVLTFTINGLSDSDDHYFAVTAYDGSGNESPYSNTVHSAPVSASNAAPVLASIGNKSLLEGATINFTVSASDADGDALSYSATSLPTGAGFNGSTGVFSWTPASNQAGQYSITFSVSDGNATDAETIQITVTDVAVNQAPVINPISDKGIDEGETQYIPISATDADGDNLTFSVNNLPQGAIFNSATRMFNWQPSYSQAGTYSLTVVVSDGRLSDSEQFTITVRNVNQAPVLSPVGAKNVNEDNLLSFIINASDADGDSLEYSAGGLPSGAVFNTSSRTFSWTPTSAQAGNYTVVFNVSDGTLSDSEQISIAVGNVNRAPVLDAIGAKTVAEGETLSFAIRAVDGDGDSLSYSASGLPSGAVFNSSTRSFSWTPTFTQAGTYQLSFSVGDGNLVDVEQVSITVSDRNRIPVLNAVGMQSVGEGSLLSFTVSGSDPDGDALTYRADGLPAGAVFNPLTRLFSWTPDYQTSDNTRVYPVTFVVSDGQLESSEAVTINVTNVNRAPVLSGIGAQSLTEGDSFNLLIKASDPDNDSLLYSAASLPDGAVFTPSTRSFSWIPGNDQAGTYQVEFSVSDGQLTDKESVTITVSNGNESPLLATIGNKSIAENESLDFVVSATDPNGDALSYSVTGLPAGALFNSSERHFSWTPDYTQAGSFNITFTVSDSLFSDSESIAITVVNTNRGPVISGSPADGVMATTAYSFTPTASDPDGDPLTFTITNKPVWAQFSAASGKLSGTPSESQTGIFDNIMISVSDGQITSALAPFSIAVADYALVDSDGDGVPDHIDAFPNDASESVDTDGDNIGNNSDNDDDNDGVADVRDGFPLDADRVGWMITATAGAGGYISPEGTSTVLFGGSLQYRLTPKAGFYVSDLLVDNASVGLVGHYEFQNIGAHHTIEAVFAPIPAGLSSDPLASGLVGVERVDGGDDSNNLVDGKPKLALDYRFGVVLRDNAQADQRKVYMVLNGYKYLMELSEGSIASGADYSFTTRLGPAFTHRFHFVAEDPAAKELWRYPASGEFNGPVVELLNGRNILGMAVDINAHALDSNEAFSQKNVYRWEPEVGPKGSYRLADSGAPVSNGEGYVLKKTSGGTLPDRSHYGELSDALYQMQLKQGWNLISNPYGGNVSLRDIAIRRGSDAPLPWLEAVEANLVVDVIYTYKGDDWDRDNEFFNAAGDQPAVLIPWIGYWIYVSPSDQTMSILIPRPLK